MANITSLLPPVVPVGSDIVYGVTDPLGTPADAVFEAKQLGSWVRLATAPLSGASVDVTSIGDGTIAILRISLLQVILDTNNIDLGLQVKTGSTVQTTNYDYAVFTANAAGGSTVRNATSGTYAEIGYHIGNGAGEQYEGTVELYAPQATSRKRMQIFGVWNEASASRMVFSQGAALWHGTAAAITGFRLLPVGGNFTSGVVDVWGLKGP